MNETHPLGEPAELAALYMAGALPQDELAAFEAHLGEGCEVCQAELDQASQVAVSLWRAVRPVLPDARIRDALLARIAAKAEAEYQEKIRADPSSSRPPQTVGYDPGFDLWSTAGGTTAAHRCLPRRGATILSR